VGSSQVGKHERPPQLGLIPDARSKVILFGPDTLPQNRSLVFGRGFFTFGTLTHLAKGRRPRGIFGFRTRPPRHWMLWMEPGNMICWLLRQTNLQNMFDGAGLSQTATTEFKSIFMLAKSLSPHRDSLLILRRSDAVCFLSGASSK